MKWSWTPGDGAARRFLRELVTAIGTVEIDHHHPDAWVVCGSLAEGQRGISLCGDRASVKDASVPQDIVDAAHRASRQRASRLAPLEVWFLWRGSLKGPKRTEDLAAFRETHALLTRDVDDPLAWGPDVVVRTGETLWDALREPTELVSTWDDDHLDLSRHLLVTVGKDAYEELRRSAPEVAAHGKVVQLAVAEGSLRGVDVLGAAIRHLLGGREPVVRVLAPSLRGAHPYLQEHVEGWLAQVGLGGHSTAQGDLTVVLQTDTADRDGAFLEGLHDAKASDGAVLWLDACVEGLDRGPVLRGDVPEIQLGELDDTVRVQRGALRVLLGHLLFAASAGRWRSRGAGLRLEVFSRPLEAADAVLGRVDPRRPTWVLHPDPPLPRRERVSLARAWPQVVPVTPTTLQAALEGATHDPEGSKGMVVTSISDAPEAVEMDGVVAADLVRASLIILRTLLSSGWQVSYGGDLRRTSGFTRVMAGLVHGHNTAGGDAYPALKWYAAALFKVQEHERPVGLTAEQVPWTEAQRDPQRPSAEDPLQVAVDVLTLERCTAGRQQGLLQLTAMRLRMTLDGVGRVVVGGNTIPKGSARGPGGYGGALPGVVEEALWSVLASKPLYVAGGFGGCGRWLAMAMRGEPMPPEAAEQIASLSTKQDQLGQDLQDAFALNAPGFGLPGGEVVAPTLEAAWARFQRLGRELGLNVAPADVTRAADTGSCLPTTGLTVAEYHALLRTRQPEEVAALVAKGLEHLRARERAERDKVVLFHGGLEEAPQARAYVVVVYPDLPLTGAAAVLDQALEGALSAALPELLDREVLVLPTPRGAGDRVVLVSLGLATEHQGLEGLLETLRRLGGRVRAVLPKDSPDPVAMPAVLASMLPEHPLRGVEAVVGSLRKGRWMICEPNDRRHGDLAAALNAAGVPFVPLEGLATGDVSGIDVLLLNTVVAPEAGPSAGRSAGEGSRRFIQARFMGAGGGVGVGQLRVSPSGDAGEPYNMDLLDLQQSNLQELNPWLLSKLGQDPEDDGRGRTLMVVHDGPAASLLVEAVGDEDSGRQLALERPVVRRLIRTDDPWRPPVVEDMRLRVLLAGLHEDGMDATGSMRRQVDEVEQALCEAFGSMAEIRRCASQEDFTGALQDGVWDIVHVAVHGSHDRRDGSQSRLDFDGGELIAATLAKMYTLPRFVFFNACLAGVLEDDGDGFADAVAQMGATCFLAPRISVGLELAGRFAVGVYQELGKGSTVAQAVWRVRKNLAADHAEPNQPLVSTVYVLFGGHDLSFRHLRPVAPGPS